MHVIDSNKVHYVQVLYAQGFTISNQGEFSMAPVNKVINRRNFRRAQGASSVVTPCAGFLKPVTVDYREMGLYIEFAVFRQPEPA